jgi:hypothetical protein
LAGRRDRRVKEKQKESFKKEEEWAFANTKKTLSSTPLF